MRCLSYGKKILAYIVKMASYEQSCPMLAVQVNYEEFSLWDLLSKPLIHCFLVHIEKNPQEFVVTAQVPLLVPL